MARVLLMEDEALQRAQIAMMLETAGHEVDACFSAGEALRRAQEAPYDLLITDIIVQIGGRSLPDGGISLIGQMRRVDSKSATPATVPIIAITGTYKNPGMEHILTTARQVGANAKMEKPIQAEELITLVDDLLAGET